MNLQKLEEILQNVDLNGYNYEDETIVSFMPLTKNWTSEEQKKYVAFIEQLYLQLCNQYGEVGVRPMEVSSDSVVIPDGKIFHRSRIDMEKLGQISVGGILASEWFGILESEREGCFCSFAQQYLSPETVKERRCYTYRDFFITVASRPETVMFFLDETHPIMQQLMRLDYFRYEYLKRTNPEELPKIYTEEEIAMFDNLIEPLSPGGVYRRGDPRSIFNYWFAFVGGIPPQVINGICISSKNLNFINNLPLICEMFPNATIFDENKHVLAYPKNHEENMGMGVR